MSFKDQLRKLRESKGIKISELAKKAGVSAGYISMIENGLLKNDPSEKLIRKLEDALGEKTGTLTTFASTGGTTAIKAIYAVPDQAKKMDIILDEIITDPSVLDKILKSMGKG